MSYPHPIRAALLPASERPKESVYCAKPGCGIFTRNGKTFCTKHVLLMPYAQRVVRNLRKRKRELLLRGRLAREDILVQDVEAALSTGNALSMRKLASVAGAPRDRIEAALEPLERDRVVRVDRCHTTRGELVTVRLREAPL